MTEPARHLVKAGDYIVECNGKKIADKKRLQDTLKKLDAEEVVLKLRRDSGYLDVKIKPVRNKKNQYMLGIWVRDNAQGLGTVTFLNTDSRFGALGHGIHDTDTNTLMEIKRRKGLRDQHSQYPERSRRGTGRDRRNHRL